MSPMLSPRLSDLPGSPLNSTDNVLGQFEEGSSVRDSLGGTYNDDVPETELLGSSPPRPKKVSSTDRLKALARSSTEDTSKWTVVGDLQGSDDEEDELVMGGRSGSLRGMVAQAANQAQPSLAGMSQSSAGHYINDPRLPTQMGAGLPIVRERDEDADPEEEQDYDSSDSDELAMPARGSKKLQPSSSSTGTASRPIKTAPPAPSTGTAGTSRSSVPASASTPATSTSDGTSHAESQVDEEDMFDFDDEHHDSSKASEKAKTASSKYIDEEEDEAEADSPVTTPSRRAAPPPDLSSSAPRNITATKLPPPPKSPTSAIAAGLMGTSMGSYKGRSIMFGVVKNEQLHEQASRMGNFTSFVGSVDGRTGVDEKGSYRPGSMAFSGTPKSFSERMLREELEEEEAARKDESAVP
ncbi:hypothetical protein Micbo1qcDRAFT_156377 [Microdochium bolleyi]|uniref:Uncharacterized protein n=1 Tax=Microdochium bolleyi TaxID=196109 RepID=A0A136JK03_9PEZI|nr:hypothetical protein Micbo1qcDRAFT_156377 [Microdochium bolleyi]